VVLTSKGQVSGGAGAGPPLLSRGAAGMRAASLRLSRQRCRRGIGLDQVLGHDMGRWPASTGRKNAVPCSTWRPNWPPA